MLWDVEVDGYDDDDEVDCGGCLLEGRLLLLLLVLLVDAMGLLPEDGAAAEVTPLLSATTLRFHRPPAPAARLAHVFGAGAAGCDAATGVDDTVAGGGAVVLGVEIAAEAVVGLLLDSAATDAVELEAAGCLASTTSLLTTGELLVSLALGAGLEDASTMGDAALSGALALGTTGEVTEGTAAEEEEVVASPSTVVLVGTGTATGSGKAAFASTAGEATDGGAGWLCGGATDAAGIGTGAAGATAGDDSDATDSVAE